PRKGRGSGSRSLGNFRRDPALGARRPEDAVLYLVPAGAHLDVRRAKADQHDDDREREGGPPPGKPPRLGGVALSRRPDVYRRPVHHPSRWQISFPGILPKRVV